MEGLFFGIDLGEKNTILSFYSSSMSEPGSVSTVMGSSEYQIPTCLAKRKGLDQWFYGKDAKNMISSGGAVEAENLYEKAILNEEIELEGKSYPARDLLAIYIKYLLEISGQPIMSSFVKKLVITVETLSLDVAEMCSVVSRKLMIPEDRLLVIDHMEAFYYYALNQDPATYFHDVLLLDCDKLNLKYSFLNLDRHKSPVLVNLNSGTDRLDEGKKDTALLNSLHVLLKSNLVSSVYLVGDGFDGGWMQSSMEFLLQKRRVFIGKNLYSKGACFAGFVKQDGFKWNYAYIGSNELKMNVSLKVNDDNKIQFHSILDAGESWFQSQGECEVILMGSKEIEFWIQRPESRSATVEKLVLDSLPDREEGTTRLRISAKALSDKEVELTIRDLGFGEIAPGSQKSFTHKIKLKEEANV